MISIKTLYFDVGNAVKGICDRVYARTGRPKAEKPFDHKVTVKFKEEEYQVMVEYAETHNLSISQLIRLGVELQLKNQSNQ